MHLLSYKIINILIFNSWAIVELCALVNVAAVAWEIYKSNKIMLNTVGEDHYNVTLYEIIK